MDTLKTMLAAIFEEDGVELPETRIKNTKAKEWIQRMRQSMRLEPLQTQYEKLAELGVQLDQIETSLWQLQPRLVQDLSQLEQQRADAEAAFQALERERRQAQQAYEENRDQLNDQLSSWTSQQRQASDQLDVIQARWDEFEALDMPALQLAQQQLPHWREEQEEDQQHYRLLREQQGDLHEQFKERQWALTEKLNQRLEQNNQKIRQLQTQKEALLHQLASRKAERGRDYDAQRDQMQADYQTQLDELGQHLAGLKAQQQGVFSHAEERDALQAAQARIELAQQQRQHLSKQLEQQLQQLTQRQQTRQQADEALTLARRQLSQAEAHCRALYAQRDPETGSLRYYLRSQQPGWEQTLGKVLREDLLTRSDLSPQPAAQNSSQLFNLTLDLNAIDLPDYAQEETALAEAIERAEYQTAQQAQQMREAEQTLHQANEAVKTQQQQVDQLRHERDQADQEVQYATEARDRLQAQQTQLEIQRREALDKEVQQLQQQWQKLQTQRNEALDALCEDHQGQLLELEADNQLQMDDLAQQLEQLETQIQQRRADHAAQLQELQTAHEQVLREEGVDPHTLRSVEARIQAREQQIQQTVSRQDELEAYQTFVREDWQKRKPRLVEEEARLNAQIRDAQTQLDRLKSQWQAQKAQCQAQQDSLQTQMRQAEDQLGQIRQVMNQLEALPPPSQAPQTLQQAGDLAERLERARSGLKQRAQWLRDLQERFARFEAELVRDAQASFIELFHQQKQTLLDAKEGMDMDERQFIPLISELLQLLQDQQHLLLEEGRNLGGDLSKFFTVFRDLNRRIKEQSRRLSKEVADDLQLEGIRRSEVRIQSTIDELGFWEPLKQFNQLYLEWRDSGQPLPGEAYLNALADVVELLRSDQSYSFESLLRLELHLNEGGTDLVIKNDRQLLESSSHGMAYLILCKFLLAFTRLLRGQAEIAIHWPIDEIGTLAYHNVEKLFLACEANRIHIVGAFPNPESDVLMLFRHRYLIDQDQQQPTRRVLKRIEPRLSRLAERLQAHQTTEVNA